MKGKNAFIVGFFCLVLVMGSLYAFRVTPARLDLTIARGKTVEVVLNLIGSRGAGREHLMVFPTDISMKRDGSLNFSRLEGFEYSAVPWIKLEQTRITLLGGQKKELKFKISVPRRAKPGEYYAVIMVEPTEFTNVRTKDKPFMIKMKSRIAVVLVINVPGRIYEKKGEVVLAKVDETNGKIKITSTFRNAGNIHLDVSGTAIIRSKDGRTSFGQVALMAKGSQRKKAFVFPGNLRDFVGVLERPLPRGEYVVEVAFDYGHKFKKAKLGSSFSITRQVKIDESKMEFLLVKPSTIELEVPSGALRTKVIRVVNTDYRSISVSVVSENGWIKVSPTSFVLKPGQSKNLKAVLSITDDKKERKAGKIVLRSDRGKPTEIKVLVCKPGKMPKKEKIKKGGVL